MATKRTISTILAALTIASVTPSVYATAIHDAGRFTTTLAANDDESTGPVDLGFSANINGTTYNQTYVNNNGNITFDDPLGTYTPSAIRDGGFGPIIAPFFADVDTSGSGSGLVSYGTATLNGRNAFGVNYIHVGDYYEQPIYNSFQLILTDRSDTGAGNFDIQFNYDKIAWEAGTASGASWGGLCQSTDRDCTSALAGYWTSDSSNATLAGSLAHGALVDGGPHALISHSLNSNTLGQYNFQVRGGTVVQPPASNVPEPASLALLGIGLAGLGAMRRRKAS